MDKLLDQNLSTCLETSSQLNATLIISQKSSTSPSANLGAHGFLHSLPVTEVSASHPSLYLSLLTLHYL